jgi:hypothetical protein
MVKSCPPRIFISDHLGREKTQPFIGQEFNVTAAPGRQEDEEGAFPIYAR